EYETAVVRPTLGAALEPPGTILVSQLALGGQGLLVTSVQPDSPAAQAGFRVHDILWEVDGKAVPANQTEFQKTLAALKPETPVDALVLRKGQRMTLTLSLPKPVGVRFSTNSGLGPDR